MFGEPVAVNGWEPTAIVKGVLINGDATLTAVDGTNFLVLGNGLAIFIFIFTFLALPGKRVLIPQVK